MARTSTKRPAKPKSARGKIPGIADEALNAPNGAPENAVMAESEPVDSQPAPSPVEPAAQPGQAGKKAAPAAAPKAKDGKAQDVIVTSLNIAKLQAMSMTELNHMAKDLGVENFGTMRKHEVIFHILQKNAERSGVLFSEGVLEVLSEGFGFLRSQSFNYLPCPADLYVSSSHIRRFDLPTGNLT